MQRPMEVSTFAFSLKGVAFDCKTDSRAEELLMWPTLIRDLKRMAAWSP